MTTRRGSVAALAATLVVLQLLCVGVCTAADPVVPVSARSFTVDVTDMSIEKIHVSTAGSVDMSQACTGSGNTRVTVQVVGGSDKTQNPLENPACFTYNNTTRTLALDLDASGCVDAAAAVSVQVSLPSPAFDVDVVVAGTEGDTAVSMCLGDIPRIGTMTVSSTSGSIAVQYVNALGSASFTSKSGAVTLSNVLASNVTATTSGQITASNATSYYTWENALTPLSLHGGDVTISDYAIGSSVDVQATGQVKLQGGGLYGLCAGLAVTAAGDVDLLLGMLQGPSIALTSTTASITVDSSFVMVEPPPQGSSSGCGSASVSATPGGFVMNAPKGNKTSTDMVVSMSDKASERGSRVWARLPLHDQ